MEKSPDKWVVFYASCGEGHKKIAYGLKERFNIPAYDILDYCPPFFKLFYSEGYNFIIQKAIFLWKILFNLSKNRFFLKFIYLWHRIIFKKFLKFLSSSGFEVIISTHFFIPPLVGLLKKKKSLKNMVIITDFGVHPIWKEKNVDLYFVAFPQTKDELAQLGAEKDKIVVSGFPLREGFFKKIDKEKLKRKFFPENKKEILLFFNYGKNIPFLKKAIAELKKDFNIIVIYGKNKIKEIDESLKLISYYEKIWELMAISLLIVTKPGGVTSFEALFLKKPLIIPHFILGQEEENFKFLEKLEVAFRVNSVFELIEKIYYVKNNYSSILKRFPSLSEATEIIKEKIEKL